MFIIKQIKFVVNRFQQFIFVYLKIQIKIV
nr:MAG TPA: hypothetical protein [Caudoviricetes sp.]